ncbi:histidine phosphatase family protein [Dictyobacter vulcani]|uniref:histidine phosphatase family protein n=1 Tax=Dictyobacter vulcani TaxID=2607529 RepID=UPI0018E9EB55
MTHLYLIRHGEAMSAVERFVGDGGLSPLGILQAQRLRDRLAATKEIAADVLIASTFPEPCRPRRLSLLRLGYRCISTMRFRNCVLVRLRVCQ